MVKPKISIVIPTHKRPHYLKHSLVSIFSQTLLPDEVVVTEDGRDDETRELVSLYAMMNPKVKVVHLVNEVPLGQLGNRQNGFFHATGDLLGMLDDDDMWEPMFIEKTSKALEENPDCGFCSSNHYFIDENNNLLREKSEEFRKYCGRSELTDSSYSNVFLRTLNNKACIFSLHSTLFRKESLQKVGYFQQFGGLVPDYMLMLALGANRVKGYFLTDFLGNSREHSGQQSGRRLENAISKVEGLSGIFKEYGHLLSKEEEKALRKKYQSAILECSISYAHEKKRYSSLVICSKIYRYGFGIPSLKRLIVLAVLLFGAKKRQYAE